MVETWSEIMGIQSAVHEAIWREEEQERETKKEFEQWKKIQKKNQNIKINS